MTNQQKTLLGIVLAIAVIGGGLYAYNQHEMRERGEGYEAENGGDEDITSATHETINTSNGSNDSINVATSSTNNNVSTSSNTTTKTKTGSATVSFNVPDNFTNQMTVNVSMKDGNITDVTYKEVTAANDEASNYWLSNFSKALDKNQIVGKKLSQVSLSKVGGASLTTKAFMNALNQAAGKAI